MSPRGGSGTSLPWDDVPYPAPDAASDPAPDAGVAPGGPDALDPASGASGPVPQGSGTWDGFVQYCLERNGEGGNGLSVLQRVRGRCAGGRLTIETNFSTLYNQLCSPSNKNALAEHARAYFGDGTTVEVQPPATRIKTPSELRVEAERHPAVGLLREQFGATMLSCRPLADGQPQ